MLTFPLSVSIAGDKELLFAEEMEVVLWERTVDTLGAELTEEDTFLLLDADFSVLFFPLG